ncbi:HAD-IA family hydrolase [Aliikangiella sp. G2MR2-5]|uniref:HAD-IA family hydrolase n=1 Tax=Aliikangiella sp. G2MR2-5 TaxID=2788943 RepID=UPI001AEE5B70|nr:HAD-IA family hydrolase [Aliikangiella sp. G2MR2-5]
MSILKERYSLVIFDWDGTLMDSTGRIVSAMQTTARNLSLPVPSVEKVKSIIGLGMDEVLDVIIPEADLDTRNKMLVEYRYQYIEGDNTPTPLFPGSRDLISWLKEQGVIVTVATGKARAGLNRVLGEENLLDFFHHTICADEAQSKPNSEMVERLINVSNSTKSETIVIGDSVHDLAMANNARVDSIGVTSGANSRQTLESHRPIAILDSVCHLKDWFKQ